MRFGVFSIVTLLAFCFLIIISQSDIQFEEVDRIFEDLDQNTFDNLDANITDANLGSFIKYSAKGVLDELHGTYYLMAWANTVFPSWVIENLNLIFVLVFLAIISPLLFYGGLTIILVIMVLHEKIKEWQKKRGKG